MQWEMALLRISIRPVKNLLKKVAAERPKDWHHYLGPLMFAVRDTSLDSTGFTPFQLLYGYRVRTPVTLLKRIWMGSQVKTAYQYVVDLRERIEETCELAKNELSKVQVETRSIIREPERGSSMLGTVCYCCYAQSKSS